MAAKKCHLLALSAELRNKIYDLAFTPDHDSDEEIDLRAQPPSSKALLQTCRQVYTEAHSMYVRAYRDFWTETRFVVDATLANESQRPFPTHGFFNIEAPRGQRHFLAVSRPREEDVQHIQHLTIKIKEQFGSQRVEEYTLLSNKCSWFLSVSAHDLTPQRKTFVDFKGTVMKSHIASSEAEEGKWLREGRPKDHEDGLRMGVKDQALSILRPVATRQEILALGYGTLIGYLHRKPRPVWK